MGKSKAGPSWSFKQPDGTFFTVLCQTVSPDTQVENVQVRVGAPRPIRAADFNRDQVSYKRDLGAYISERDMQQLYSKCIETEDIRNEDGIPFQIVYSVSNNTRGFWSIANARKVIDYQPEDDSERLFVEEISAHINTNGRTM
jgi:hypothetical protein